MRAGCWILLLPFAAFFPRGCGMRRTSPHSATRAGGGIFGRSPRREGREADAESPLQSLYESAESSPRSRSPSPSPPERNLISALATASLAVVAALVFVEHSENIAAFASSVFDPDRLKSRLLRTLEYVDERGGARGALLYVAALALWEAVGLSTIPVETAAGMAFGFGRGLRANVAGKVGGALLAYVVGRMFLAWRVQQKIERGESEVLSLVEWSVERTPFRTSLLVRYSVLPELVKNVGLAAMPPVGPWLFTLVTGIHSVPYSCLWTALGVDSAVRLRADETGETVAPNRVLGGVLLFATVFGIVGSPVIVGMWIRDMRREQLKIREREERGNAAQRLWTRVSGMWKKNVNPNLKGFL